MGCTYRSFKNERLCTNDLTHEISIGRRSIKGDQPDSTQKNTTITGLFELWAACETPNEYRPVKSVIDGREITHIFYVRYDEWADLIDTCHIPMIDVTQHVVTIGCDIYRIDRIKNMNERNQIIGLYCEYTGNDPA